MYWDFRTKTEIFIPFYFNKISLYCSMTARTVPKLAMVVRVGKATFTM